MTQFDALFLLLCSMMVFVMQAGFLCLEAGASRLSSAGHIALKNMSEVAVVTLVFWGIGFGLMYGDSWMGLFGTDGFVIDVNNSDGPNYQSSHLLFQIAFATTTVSILSGAVAERCRFTSYLIISTIVAMIIYPIIGHAAWAVTPDENAMGWLNTMGFVDFAGGTVVHSTGGWAALAATIFLGPRLGRFGRARGEKFAPNSVSMSTLGALLLWMGWMGFNAGSAYVFDAGTAGIVVKTLLCAAGGMVFSILFAVITQGQVRAMTMLTGMLAGLVAGTAGIHSYTATDCVVIGAVGAIIAQFTTTALISLRIDDPVQAVSVHLTPGIWGTIAVAFYANPSDLTAGGMLSQALIQATGVLFVAIWAFGGTFVLLFLADKIVTMRVSPRDEVIGLDQSEHGITPPVVTYQQYRIHKNRIKSRYARLKAEADNLT